MGNKNMVLRVVLSRTQGFENSPKVDKCMTPFKMTAYKMIFLFKFEFKMS